MSSLTRTPARILVVDDDESVVHLMQEYFVRAGYRVDFAQHGGDALTLVQHDPPDVVLLDITMPGMNGVEVLERIVALHAALPVIDRKSTRLNSSHTVISYAVFCLKKKKTEQESKYH